MMEAGFGVFIVTKLRVQILGCSWFRPFRLLLLLLLLVFVRGLGGGGGGRRGLEVVDILVVHRDFESPVLGLRLSLGLLPLQLCWGRLELYCWRRHAVAAVPESSDNLL